MGLIDNTPKTGTCDLIMSVQALEPNLLPNISEEEQAPFIELVDINLAKKKNGKDTTIEKNTIDRMGYKMYGLTKDGIKIEGK